MEPQLTPDERQLLDRFLTGDLHDGERDVVRRLLEQHPDENAFYQAWRKALRTNPQFGMPPVASESFASLRARIEALDVSGLTSTVTGQDVRRKGFGQGNRVLGFRILRRQLWVNTAVLVLGCVVLLIGWMTGGRHSGWRSTQSPLVYATNNGERATIMLPDGGTVVLNVASRLEVPVDYSVGHHTVRLVGEGLFTVPHHDGVPLTVLAGTTATRVLGTSFVVRHYTTDTTTLVVVREGKVAVGGTVVTAGHLVEAGHFGVTQVRPADASSFTFATGVLTLNALPLSAAITELDRWYGVDIRLGSPALATQRITGAFAAGSLSDLSRFLEYVLGVRVVRDGRVMTLFSKR